uniref:RpiR family transcriptional regulator n=1 Tax=Prevotella sp. GTC17260 TaxID=3236796 RepID=A0AB33JL23_9BACT
MERNKYNKIVLSTALQDWMCEHFGNTKNAEIAEHLGVSPRTVVRIARDMNLEKHPAFTKAMQRNATEHAARTNRANCGNAGIRNLLLYGKAHQFKKGERQKDKMSAEAFDAMHRRIGEQRKSVIKAEKRRVLFGLAQKTKLRVVQVPKKKICLRNGLRKKGYEIARASNEAFITAATHRSEVMERRAKSMGISFTSI